MRCGVWLVLPPGPGAVSGWVTGLSTASEGGASSAALSPQVWSHLPYHREAARARRAEPMLDLEVVPERSLGNEQWEFTLGEHGVPRQGPVH